MNMREPLRLPQTVGYETEDAKHELRQVIRKHRHMRSRAELGALGEALAENAVQAVGDARSVALYVSTGWEPPTLPLLERLRARDVAVLLPSLGPGLSRTWSFYKGAEDLQPRAPGRPPEPSGPVLEAEAIRSAVREFVEQVKDLDEDARRTALLDSGYAQPHWPAPFGRDAGAVEQLVIEEEFRAAGIKRPSYGITGWNILTLIQHANDDQIERWVRPAMEQEVIWCQLFSEPDAGSDAAGVTTKATRVDGGWLVNGQKVWTSGAHVSGFGFATVRTNPDVPKHDGITMMVIDMHAEGVEVRPLKMTSGDSEFNEVFFDDVFVPDDDVVGPVDGGWAIARATLGNESVSIGSGDGGMSFPAVGLIVPYDRHPDRLPGGDQRLGRYAANVQAATLLNLRSANRAVAGGGPGPEGAMSKLILSENLHEAAAIYVDVLGPDIAYQEGEAFIANTLVLMHRGLSIAGGTSEIKRNQIGERILGLPRDPLIS